MDTMLEVVLVKVARHRVEQVVEGITTLMEQPTLVVVVVVA